MNEYEKNRLINAMMHERNVHGYTDTDNVRKAKGEAVHFTSDDTAKYLEGLVDKIVDLVNEGDYENVSGNCLCALGALQMAEALSIIDKVSALNILLKLTKISMEIDQ